MVPALFCRFLPISVIFRFSILLVLSSYFLSSPPLPLPSPCQAKADRASAEAKALRDSGIHMVDDTEELEGSVNPNRKGGGLGEDAEWTSGIDAAIGNLSLGGRGGAGGSGAGGPIERHPEKRLKAVSKRKGVWEGGGGWGRGEGGGVRCGAGVSFFYLLYFIEGPPA